MLPNQIFNQIGHMNRIIQGISLLDRLFRRKAAEEPATPDLPDYLDNPNMAQFKKLFQDAENEKTKTT